jgi:cytochrome c
MKILLKTISVLTFALIATNCGEKKETDAYGNPIEEKKEAITEATVDPLLAKGQELFEGKGVRLVINQTLRLLVLPLKILQKFTKKKVLALLRLLMAKANL